MGVRFPAVGGSMELIWHPILCCHSQEHGSWLGERRWHQPVLGGVRDDRRLCGLLSDAAKIEYFAGSVDAVQSHKLFVWLHSVRSLMWSNPEDKIEPRRHRALDSAGSRGDFALNASSDAGRSLSCASMAHTSFFSSGAQTRGMRGAHPLGSLAVRPAASRDAHCIRNASELVAAATGRES